jgi:hypothetical protein
LYLYQISTPSPHVEVCSFSFKSGHSSRHVFLSDYFSYQINVDMHAIKIQWGMTDVSALDCLPDIITTLWPPLWIITSLLK